MKSAVTLGWILSVLCAWARRSGEVATLLEVQLTDITYHIHTDTCVKSPPSFRCTSHWGIHVLHHDGDKFLLAIPPATFPLAGSLKLDPGAIPRLAPMTTHQKSQVGYLAPVVSS